MPLFFSPNFTSLCSAKSLQDLNTIVMKMEKDSTKAEKILQIVCIYESNLFGNGIRIKIARLNHSCHPNATDIKRNYELRAISDIEPGEEIAINYRCGILVVGMRRKEIRQKIRSSSQHVFTNFSSTIYEFFYQIFCNIYLNSQMLTTDQY